MGYWNLVKESGDSESIPFIITDFKLKPDSTVVAHYGNKEVIGEWKWKQKISIGNDNFNLGLEQDVLIITKFENQHFKLGLSLIDINGVRHLSGSDERLYVKK